MCRETSDGQPLGRIGDGGVPGGLPIGVLATLPAMEGRCRYRNNSVSSMPATPVRFLQTTYRYACAAADIVENPGESVWGSVWKISESDAESLDKQEGVKITDGADVGNYRRINIQESRAADTIESRLAPQCRSAPPFSLTRAHLHRTATLTVTPTPTR